MKINSKTPSSTGGGKTKDNAPKGVLKTFNGKKYISLGGGNWQGYTPKKPAMKIQKVKPVTSYKSTGSKKGKPTKRKY